MRIPRLFWENETASEQLARDLIFEGWLEQRAQMEARALIKAQRERDTASLLERLRTGTGTPCLFAAQTLANLGVMEALPALLWRAERTRGTKKREFQVYRHAIHRLLSVASRQPEAAHIPLYLDVLRWQKRYNLHRKHAVAALAKLATSASARQLEEALPFLDDFPEIRKTIEAALQPNAILPIPAQSLAEITNLPLPVPIESSEPDSALLPLPAPAQGPYPLSLRERLFGRRPQ
jgi:hypothetical protein